MTGPKDNKGKGVRGVVLAGGRSSRFGSDKAFAVYDGETMLSRAVRLLTPICEDVIISCGLKSMTLSGLEAIPDLRPNRGPLGGIEAAMTSTSANRLLFLTCDMPLVTERLLECQLRMAQANPQAEAVVWKDPSGKIFPFPLLISRRSLPVLTGYLDASEPTERPLHSIKEAEKTLSHVKKLSVKNFLNTLSTIFIPIESQGPFANINTVEGLNAISLLPD